MPLVGHLISAPFDAAMFLSHDYPGEHITPPSLDTIQGIKPWRSWSIPSFWNHVSNSSITRIQFSPPTPTFDGSVIVMTSKQTASAAELAVEAMRSSGRAILIGERTAGSMLLQRPFALSNGWHLFLSFADYVSINSGVLKGRA